MSIDVTEYLPLAKQIAYSIWSRGGRSHDLDDLQGQAALILIQAARDYDPARAALKKYLAYQVQHRLLDYIRWRRKRLEVRGIDEVVAATMPAAPDPKIEGLEVALRLENAMYGVKFTSRQRVVFNRVRKGQGVAQIAKELKLTEGRIHQLWSAAVEKIQEHLKDPKRPVLYCLSCGQKLKRSPNHDQKWFCAPCGKGSKTAFWMTPEQISERAKLTWQTRKKRYGRSGQKKPGSSMSPEQRSERARRVWKKRKKNPNFSQHQSAISKKSAATLKKDPTWTAEIRSQIAKKRSASLSPEYRSQIARKGHATFRSKTALAPGEKYRTESGKKARRTYLANRQK